MPLASLHPQLACNHEAGYVKFCPLKQQRVCVRNNRVRGQLWEAGRSRTALPNASGEIHY